MYVKLCRQLSQSLVALDRLEGRSVIASRSLHRLVPLVHSPPLRERRLSKATTSTLSQFPGLPSGSRRNNVHSVES